MDQSGTSPPEALPKWLTEDYFRSLFRRKSPGEEVTVQNVTVNFADDERIHGRLIRAAVDVATPTGPKTLSYIVKRPGPGQFSTTPASANMNRMESLVLGEVIPAMEKVLDAVAPGKFGQFAPRLVDYGLDENRFIMTEDLSVQEFSTVDRRVGLDLEHSLAYARHLAAFHAASVAVMDRYESQINAIPRLTDSEEVKFLNEFIATSVKGVASVVDAWEDGSALAERVRMLGATLPARLAQANRARSGVLNVLCHGDMFVNNILFRGGRGVEEVRLVDFELARVGSFADDLAGCLVSAASDEVLRRHWEQVTEAYRDELNAALCALGHGARALSRDALREELRAQRAVAQFALFHVLPRTRASTAAAAAGGEAFTAPAFHDLLRLLLPRFRALGWLDEFEKTTGNLEAQVPSWLNQKYFQFLLQHQSPGTNSRVQRVHVIKCEESTSTTDVFQAAVEISFPSGIDIKFFRVRCPGDGVFCKMPATTCMLEMEALFGKLIPVAEEITAGTESEKFNAKSLSFVNDSYNFSSNIPRKGEYRFIPHKKSADLKFCLAVLRHLALLQAASMIAFERDNSMISDISKFPTSSDLQECVGTSMKSVTNHSATGQKDTSDTEKQKLRTEVSHKCFLSDKKETTVKQKDRKNKQTWQERFSEIGSVECQVKSVSLVNPNNRLEHSLQTKHNSDHISEKSEGHFTTFNTYRVIDYCDPKPSNYMLRHLDSQYPVDYQCKTVSHVNPNNRRMYNLENKIVSDKITEQSDFATFNTTSNVIDYGDLKPSENSLRLHSLYNVDCQFKSVSLLNPYNTLNNSENKNISKNISGESNEYVTALNTIYCVVDGCNQEPSENLLTLLDSQNPVDWSSLLHLSPHATTSPEVDLSSRRHSPLARAIKKPPHSVHCRTTERFIPRLEITRCVHV